MSLPLFPPSNNDRNKAGARKRPDPSFLTPSIRRPPPLMRRTRGPWNFGGSGGGVGGGSGGGSGSAGSTATGELLSYLVPTTFTSSSTASRGSCKRKSSGSSWSPVVAGGAVVAEEGVGDGGVGGGGFSSASLCIHLLPTCSRKRERKGSMRCHPA